MSYGKPLGVAFSKMVEYVTSAISGKVDNTDSRLSNARTPTSHTHPVSQITDFDPSDYLPLTGGTISGAIEYSSNFFEFIKSSGGTGFDWQINDERRALIYLDEGHDDLRLRKFDADGALGAELILYDGAGGGITASRPIDVPDPAENGHTLNRGYADSRYLVKSGLQALDVEGKITASDLTLDDPVNTSNPTITFKRSGVENGAIVGVSSRLFLKHNSNEVNLRDGYTTFSDRIEAPRITIDGGTPGTSGIEFSDGPSIWADDNGPKVQKSAAQRLLDLYEFGNQVVFRLYAATGGTTKRTRFQIDNPGGDSLTLSKGIGGDSYEVVMPPGKPLVGQTLVVQSVGADVVTMGWV